MKARKFSIVLLLALSLMTIAAACGSTGGSDALQEPVTLIYANLTEGGVDRSAVERFNRTHTDVQIEVRDYFDESNAKNRLFTEIAAGNIPDIIDMGQDLIRSSRLPYRTMVNKGLLEDLWPYIENDPELGREGVLEAPLKAAEVNGGLYIAFERVTVNSLVGAESVVGDRYSWTLEELQETFASMPEGSTILEFFYDKSNIFSYLFRMSIDSYIDWEAGLCDFTGERFRTALEFVNQFPDDTSALYRDNEDMNVQATDRLMHGYQMLTMTELSRPSEIQFLDAYYGLGGQASFAGYPMENGEAGSFFHIYGPRLAMSSTCKDKDAAWEFLRQMFLPKYEDSDELERTYVNGLPVNRSDYELLKDFDVRIGRNGRMSHAAGPVIEFRKATEEELRRYEDLVDRVDRIDLYDDEVYAIVWELAGAYFTGDKTLDETVDLIQNRVTLYVNESL